MRKLLCFSVALIASFAIFGCAKDDEMTEDNSMESVIRDAQKKEGSQTSKENEWKPKSGPASSEGADKDAPKSGN